MKKCIRHKVDSVGNSGVAPLGVLKTIFIINVLYFSSSTYIHIFPLWFIFDKPAAQKTTKYKNTNQCNYVYYRRARWFLDCEKIVLLEDQVFIYVPVIRAYGSAVSTRFTLPNRISLELLSRTEIKLNSCIQIENNWEFSEPPSPTWGLASIHSGWWYQDTHTGWKNKD